MREDGFAGVADLAAIGTLVADRTRCQILLALLDGQKLSASNLAAVAGVSAATASSHLSKLARAGLLRVEPEGRHRIYRIARPEVADLIRALEFFADPVRAARGS
jgi:DNA-binding transcriptional ArsR family regulator